jgi:hypothetical protein
MIDQHNIAAYIDFLHQKKHNTPAPQELIARWTSLSDFEIIAQLQALYAHWGIDEPTAHTYERLFVLASTAVSPDTKSVPAHLPPTEELTLSRPKSKSIIWILFGVLVAIFAGWLIYKQNKLEESAGTLQQRIDTVDTKAEQARIEEEQRLKRAQEQALAELARKRKDKANISKKVKYEIKYEVGNILGGIKNVQIHVHNTSDYKLNELTFRIAYIKKNGEVHDEATVKVYNLAARASTTVEAPSSGRGVEATIQLVTVQSDELDAIP